MNRASRLHILHPPHPVRHDPVPVAPPVPTPVPTPPSPPVPTNSVVVQLLFHASTGVIVLEGTGTYQSDGSLDVTTAGFTAPAAGTVVQIVIYGPGGPIITEGTTGEVGADGALTIR